MSHELSLKIKNIQIYLKIPMVITSRTLIILYSFSSIFSRKNSILFIHQIKYPVRNSSKILFVLILDEKVIDMEKELNNFWNEEYPYVVKKISTINMFYDNISD